MRRVKTWPCDAEDCIQRVIVTKRDYRLMLAVVRAAEVGDLIDISEAVYAFNAGGKRK